ncbi:MAG: hypothetical protein AAFR01_13165, partial [Pseudomonadota bacterium]
MRMRRGASNASGSFGPWGRAILTVFAVVFVSVAASTAFSDPAPAAGIENAPIVKRHMGASRHQSNRFPKRESDQAVISGWPLYRNDRGQQAFNQAMATLRATEGPSPRANAFRTCPKLDCPVVVPKISQRGWMPSGRLWLSPTEYIVFAVSPRPFRGGGYRRRPKSQMQLFVYHEFHNATRNTDVYDTISAHRRSVFVSFYLSTVHRDAAGRRFVVLVQSAPHNVVSRHASNRGNRGAGIEVAANYGTPLAPLQKKAGVIVGQMMKEREPQIRHVHHRHREGLTLLRAWQRYRRNAKRAAPG